MKGLILTLCAALIIVGCASKKNLDARVKSYMSDTVVKSFDDPSSYQFVSMKVDTIKGKDEYDNLERMSKDTVLFDSVQREKMKTELSGLQGNTKYLDSVLNYSINVSFRGKNKLGSLILDNVKLKYLPATDKMEVVN